MADARDSTVVVGYDGGPQAGDALALGELLCEALEAKLVLACVFPFDPRISTPGSEEERAVERRRCEELLRDAPLTRFAGRNVERVALPAGSAAHGLHELVVAREADLLVLGSVHRGPLQRVMPGSVATRLLHGTPCPVAVAPRGYAAGEPKLVTVGLAFDGMDEARVAAREAARVALAADAALRVLAVVDTFGALYLGLERGTVLNVVETELRERLEQLLSSFPAELRSDARVIRGPVPRTLLSEAGGVDLLVLGSRGYGPLGNVFLGSVSNEVVHAAPCPVMVVPRRRDG